MRLAKDLGQTLEQLLEMSDLEYRMWMAYYNIDYKKQQESMRKRKNGRR